MSTQIFSFAVHCVGLVFACGHLIEHFTVRDAVGRRLAGSVLFGLVIGGAAWLGYSAVDADGDTAAYAVVEGIGAAALLFIGLFVTHGPVLHGAGPVAPAPRPRMAAVAESDLVVPSLSLLFWVAFAALELLAVLFLGVGFYRGSVA